MYLSGKVLTTGGLNSSANSHLYTSTLKGLLLRDYFWFMNSLEAFPILSLEDVHGMSIYVLYTVTGLTLYWIPTQAEVILLYVLDLFGFCFTLINAITESLTQALNCDVFVHHTHHQLICQPLIELMYVFHETLSNKSALQHGISPGFSHNLISSSPLVFDSCHHS